jgi:hypothetical protein
MVSSAIIGIANYAIYMATIDYMICAYGPYSASATGGNGWSRDFLAGVLTVPATPFYSNIGAEKGMNLPYASTILFCISIVLVTAVYVIYWKGPTLRKRSPFAQSLAAGEVEQGRRPSMVKTGASSRRGSYAYSRRAASRHSSRQASRNNSYDNSASTTPGVNSETTASNQPHLGGGSRNSSFYKSQQAANRSRNASRRNSSEAGLTDPQHTAGEHDSRNLATIESVRTEV